MAKARQKKRTHKKVDPEAEAAPKSMVIQTSSAHSGKSLAQLTRDTRLMMSPHTAIRLKERKSNKLRDFSSMAGPLGVSHLLLFNQSGSGPTLRIARTPAGPTLYFRITSYSLTSDVSKVQKHPRGSGGIEFNHAPVLVLNNFPSLEPSEKKAHPEEELLRTTLQNLFPAIRAATADVRDMRRVVLFSRDPRSDGVEKHGSEIELRHYAVTTREIIADKRLRKLEANVRVHGNGGVAGVKKEEEDSEDDGLGNRGPRPLQSKRKGAIPNLGHLATIDDFLNDPSLSGLSASESEYEEDARVTVPLRGTKRRRTASERARDDDGGEAGGEEKRGVKLTELGPRLRLQLYKVTSGLSEGAVLFHRDVTLTAAQQADQEHAAQERTQLKRNRVQQQRDNIAAKQAQKEALGGSRTKRAKLRARERDAADAAGEDEASDDEQTGADVKAMTEQELDDELAFGGGADDEDDDGEEEETASEEEEESE